MLFLAAADLPEEAKEKLSSYGDVLEFSTDGIVYPSVSNHPDIFFCQTDSGLVYAPNTPEKLIRALKEYSVNLIKGATPVGTKYPQSAYYNAVVSGKYFIHNEKITDAELKRVVADKEFISVKQGYTRCSLLTLKNLSSSDSAGEESALITSDEGIYKTVSKFIPQVLYVNPEGIILKGEKNGFFGGCAGVYDDTIFLSGSLSFFKDGQKVKSFAETQGFKIVELFNSPLTDIGSILIV